MHTGRLSSLSSHTSHHFSIHATFNLEQFARKGLQCDNIYRVNTCSLNQNQNHTYYFYFTLCTFCKYCQNYIPYYLLYFIQFSICIYLLIIHVIAHYLLGLHLTVYLSTCMLNCYEAISQIVGSLKYFYSILF